jgi:predicted 3-demethylubiquinone-9 3-methyltransferase (glyoxalase superfamily)
MASSVETFLMFQGQGEAALDFYASIFTGITIVRKEYWQAGEPGKEGSFKIAKFEFLGQRFVCFDSPSPHQFNFTASISIFLTCEDQAEIYRLYSALAEGGQELMPLGNYGFSRKFGWTNDRFGVSWQLDLP